LSDEERNLVNVNIFFIFHGLIDIVLLDMASTYR
jgi:hypothetical protein